MAAGADTVIGIAAIGTIVANSNGSPFLCTSRNLASACMIDRASSKRPTSYKRKANIIVRCCISPAESQAVVFER